jgi:hypothetical protein
MLHCGTLHAFCSHGSVMKILFNLLRVLVVVILIIVGLQMFASETGEVVVITTVDAENTPQRTRVWVVDRDGEQWLRAGSEQAGWFKRMLVSPRIDVLRNGVQASYTVVPVPEETPAINALMAEKYGWADAYVGALFSRNHAVAIRLEPVDPAS